ncbi:hypothetical protein OIV83_000685 [Microbotryomycetes sp. JL201]|nr:hypothetical protein OIV83_000685 [Microbotryomycetes sp. JL201]
MDRSYGSASASMLVQTPSPAARTLYPDLKRQVNPPAYNNAGGVKSMTSTSSALINRNVRFTDADASTTISSAPPSRVQSMSQPASVSPKARLAVSTSPQQHHSHSGPHHPTSTPAKSLFPASAASKAAALANKLPANAPVHFNLSPVRKAAAAAAAISTAPKAAEKHRRPPPIGRAEAARRLRINAMMLVVWWLSSRTYTYKFMAGHLVQLVPSLDTPLHFVETLLALTLFYNILDAMKSLNRLSTLGSASINPVTSVAPRPTATANTPHLHTPIRSSPKTRPSPSVGSAAIGTASPPTPLFRASAMASPNPPSPQTPSSLSSKPAAQALRRSFGPGVNGSPTAMLSGSPLSAVAANAADAVDKGSPVSAFKARHAATPTKLSVNSQDAIDRIF